MKRLGAVEMWRRLLRRRHRLLAPLRRRLERDDLMLSSAGLAFFFLLTIVPLLLVFTTIFGFVALDSWQLRSRLFEWVGRVSPSGAVTSLLRESVSEISREASADKILIGLIVALWASSFGVAAIGRVLNAAYGVREGRRWLMRRLQGMALVIAFAVVSLVALAMVFFGGRLADRLVEMWSSATLLLVIWHVGRWLILLVALILAFDLLLNLTPNISRQQQGWFSPGAVLGVTLWLGASYGLRAFLELAPITTTYGSLAVVIALLFWFFVTGASILIGGELNSELTDPG